MKKLRKGLASLFANDHRGRQTVFNLFFAVVFLGLIWSRFGYPLPTAELEFRRLERENLLPPSEIQGVFQGGYSHRIVYGVQEDQVVLAVLGYQRPKYWPREKEGPTLFPASEFNAYPSQLLFAAADVPEGTASARLEMTVDCWFAANSGGGTSFSALKGDGGLDWARWARDYRAEGELLKDGGMLFRIPRRDEDSVTSVEGTMFSALTGQNVWYQPAAVRGLNCRMEAVFYDGNGIELGRAALATAEQGQ